MHERPEEKRQLVDQVYACSGRGNRHFRRSAFGFLSSAVAQRGFVEYVGRRLFSFALSAGEFAEYVFSGHVFSVAR